VVSDKNAHTKFVIDRTYVALLIICLNKRDNARLMSELFSNYFSNYLNVLAIFSLGYLKE